MERTSTSICKKDSQLADPNEDMVKMLKVSSKDFKPATIKTLKELLENDINNINLESISKIKNKIRYQEELTGKFRKEECNNKKNHWVYLIK